ncbi:MAG: hypothetical protein EYC62_00390 [Alphaproteobacteria bacterium]|nr:MAG: hypothetical protein EYC62_00390 [Alphaproteobacteria bacterium]
MSWYLRPLAIIFLLALASCGFSPLYATPGRGEVGDTAELRQLEILPIENRAGQELRNALLSILPETDGAPRYRLSVKLTEYIDDFGIRRDTTATFARLTVTADYQLQDLKLPEGAPPLLNGTLRAVNSYNILASTFATLSAEEDARSRASRQLAQDLKLRLGAYFKAKTN